jgi:hypothetical protein
MDWVEADRAVEQLRRAADDDSRGWRRALRDAHMVVGKRLAVATGQKHWLQYGGRRPVNPDDLRSIADDIERLARIDTDIEPVAELRRVDIALHDLIPR